MKSHRLFKPPGNTAWEATLQRSGGLFAGWLDGARTGVQCFPLLAPRWQRRGGYSFSFFARRNQGGHSPLGRPDLHPNTRMKSQLLSETFRPAGTKHPITHQELHLVLPLGTADIVKSFLTTALSTQYFLCQQQSLVWEARKSTEHPPSNTFS